MTETTKRDEREAFEAWFASQWPLTFQAIKADTADEDAWDSYRLAENAWHAALATAPEQTGEAAVRADNEVLDWLETEISAVSCWHHGTPSYEHDANWMKDRALHLIGEARKSFAPPTASTNRLTDIQRQAIELAITYMQQYGAYSKRSEHVQALRAIIAATEGK